MAEDVVADTILHGDMDMAEETGVPFQLSMGNLLVLLVIAPVTTDGED